MCEANKKNFEDHEQRLIRINKQTSNYDDLVKKISDNDAQRRILESRVNNELSMIRNTGEINRTNISYIQIELAEHVRSLNS